MSYLILPTIQQFKAEATYFTKHEQPNLTHSQAMNELAKEYGYPSWNNIKTFLIDEPCPEWWFDRDRTSERTQKFTVLAKKKQKNFGIESFLYLYPDTDEVTGVFRYRYDNETVKKDYNAIEIIEKSEDELKAFWENEVNNYIRVMLTNDRENRRLAKLVETGDRFYSPQSGKFWEVVNTNEILIIMVEINSTELPLYEVPVTGFATPKELENEETRNEICLSVDTHSTTDDTSRYLGIIKQKEGMIYCDNQADELIILLPKSENVHFWRNPEKEKKKDHKKQKKVARVFTNEEMEEVGMWDFSRAREIYEKAEKLKKKVTSGYPEKYADEEWAELLKEANNLNGESLDISHISYLYFVIATIYKEIGEENKALVYAFCGSEIAIINHRDRNPNKKFFVSEFVPMPNIFITDFAIEIGDMKWAIIFASETREIPRESFIIDDKTYSEMIEKREALLSFKLLDTDQEEMENGIAERMKILEMQGFSPAFYEIYNDDDAKKWNTLAKERMEKRVSSGNIPFL